MTTIYTKQDVLSFANYLASPQRKELIQDAYDRDIEDAVMNPLPVEERLKDFTDADFENWKGGLIQIK